MHIRSKDIEDNAYNVKVIEYKVNVIEDNEYKVNVIFGQRLGSDRNVRCS